MCLLQMPMSTGEEDGVGTAHGVCVDVAIFLVGMGEGDEVEVGVVEGAGVEVGWGLSGCL